MISDTITLFEHQYRSYDDINLYPQDLTRRERVLEEIERFNLNQGKEIIRVERKGLSAAQYVGVVSVGEKIIQILPKIDYIDPGASTTRTKPGPFSGEVQSAAQNLLVMLSYSNDLRLHEETIVKLSKQKSDWFEVLTHLLAVNLQQQTHLGITHHYVSREETLPVLRGRWDLQRQVLQHGHTHHNFDVTFDDYSVNIPLNQVFRYVVEQLLLHSRDPENRLILGDLRERLQPVTLLPEIPLSLLDSIHFTRLNDRFQPAFNLSRLFLTHTTIQFNPGSDHLFAFLFDMNQLFERFVASFLKKHCRQILPQDWQDVRIISQSQRHRFYLATCNGQNTMLLRPDLFFRRVGQASPLLIVDTKYKRLDLRHPRSGISPGDVYQILAYAVRLSCPWVMLLYPHSPGSPVLRKQLKIQTGSVRLDVNTIDLHVPLAQPGSLIDELKNIFRDQLKD